MEELKCSNCGAPLKLRPRDIRRGVAWCEFCGNTYKFDAPEAELDEDLKKGLKFLSKVQGLLGIELEETDEPAVRPEDTKIRLQNMPGIRFHAKISRTGLSVQNVFMAIFTAFWCGFMILWNTIAIVQSGWVMLAFGLLHDAVGVFLLMSVMWSFFGKEELIAEGETFRQVKRVFCIRSTKEIPLIRIDDVAFKVASRQKGTIRKGLYLMIGTKKRRIAGNASMPELRWLRKELLEFFKPRW